MYKIIFLFYFHTLKNKDLSGFQVVKLWYKIYLIIPICFMYILDDRADLNKADLAERKKRATGLSLGNIMYFI